MKISLFSKLLKSDRARSVIVVVEIATLLTIIVATFGIFKSGVLTKDEATTTYIIPEQFTQSASDSSHFGGYYEDDFYFPQNTTPDSVNTQPSNAYNNGSFTPIQGNSQQSQTLENVSGWSTARILSKATEAVNKTKAYQNMVTVNHRESFDATVTECTGGAIVQSVANMMVGWVVKPVDETLNFNGGRAVNSEGETVPLILPQKSGFNLTEQGVKSASVTTRGNEYIIKINLVEENVGMHDIPRHNASAVGYLDVANFDLSFLTVESADIRYKGSSVELHINADGYVTYAEYHIPLNIRGTGNGAGISGSVTFDGEQTEIWTLNY